MIRITLVYYKYFTIILTIISHTYMLAKMLKMSFIGLIITVCAIW